MRSDIIVAEFFGISVDSD